MVERPPGRGRSWLRALRSSTAPSQLGDRMSLPPRRATPLLAGALLLTAACGTTAPAATSAAPDRVGAPVHSAHTAPAPIASGARAVPAQAAKTDPVVVLRSSLERLLGEHVLLADEGVRTTLLRQTEQNDAVSAAVDRNTDELVDVISEQAGPAAGQAFSAAWKRHVDVLGAYARALQTGDVPGQAGARREYVAAESELAKAFSVVVGGTVPIAALTAGATAHGNHLLDQAEAFAGKDYDKAYAIQGEGFSGGLGAADVFARGVATDQHLSTAELDAPRRTLQSALSGLFGHHMGLMVQSMRAAHDGTADFAAGGRAVNANTAQIASALRTLYGEDASRQFLAIWAGHVEGLYAYARAENQTERAKLHDRGADYAPDLARLLATATDQRLSSIELAAAFTEHDHHLRDSLKAYADEDFPASEQEAERGYKHMFQLSQTLAIAMGDVVAATLPQGGPATGGGGLALMHPAQGRAAQAR